MLDEDVILAIVTFLVVLSCCGCTLGMAICPCSCKPSRDCKRNCADCKRDREKCRRRCVHDCDCRRERADTEEELVG